jgi:hypothetical protein
MQIDENSPESKIIDFDEIAIRMGLEEPAQRERRRASSKSSSKIATNTLLSSS